MSEGMRIHSTTARARLVTSERCATGDSDVRFATSMPKASLASSQRFAWHARCLPSTMNHDIRPLLCVLFLTACSSEAATSDDGEADAGTAEVLPAACLIPAGCYEVRVVTEDEVTSGPGRCTGGDTTSVRRVSETDPRALPKGFCDEGDLDNQTAHTDVEACSFGLSCIKGKANNYGRDATVRVGDGTFEVSRTTWNDTVSRCVVTETHTLVADDRCVP